MHTLTEENYLKAIYRLVQSGADKITPTSIAAEVGVNAASVVDMIKKLAEKELIHYHKSSGAILTESGKSLALNIVRKHRLWEVFLVEKLKYSWDIVHEIAEQLEHIKHVELADRLEKFLGFPEFDPHGDPIPKSNGELPVTVNTLLTDMEAGKTGKVAGVKDTSSAFLQYLKQLNINIGTEIKVAEVIPFDGSISIQIGKDAKATVSKRFADNLLCLILD